MASPLSAPDDLVPELLENAAVRELNEALRAGSESSEGVKA